MRLMACAAIFCGLLLYVVGGRPAVAASLQVGDRAPGFRLAASDGNTYSLTQFAGKQGVVLAWFPKAFTPG